jgi:hypothetical protein
MTLAHRRMPSKTAAALTALTWQAFRTLPAAAGICWLQQRLIQANPAQVSSNKHGARVAGLWLQQLVHQLMLLGACVGQVNFKEAGSSRVASTKPAHGKQQAGWARQGVQSAS